MLKTSSFLAVAVCIGLLIGVSGVHAVPMNKCIVGGTVTYQQDPCPFKQVRKQPSIEVLNAAEKKRREAAEAAEASAPVKHAPTTTSSSTVPTLPSVPSNFRCDGRKVCSQMTSCEEAKYFLANCPGVTMDGDKNGIPCEKQWCSR